MLVGRKCSRCHRKAVKRGLCERCLKTPTFVPPRDFRMRPKTPLQRLDDDRSRLKRAQDYPLLNDERWQRLSRAWLIDNPWCVRCESRPKQGGGARRTPAIHTDHILPVRQFPHKAYDSTNLQSLCLKCHNVKSSHERVGRCYDYVRSKCIVI